MADYVGTHACACGGMAERSFTACPEVLVLGAARDWKIDHRSVPIGWERGNTGREQEARYAAHIEATRKLARANDKKAIRGGIRHIATVPREAVRARNNQFGKDYLDPTQQSTTELKRKLRSDGFLFHEN